MKKNPLSLAVSCAILGGAIGVLQTGSSTAANSGDCTTDCEEQAAYTLKIITHGEGAPVSANDTPKALQQNRRVDVSISVQEKIKTKVTDKSGDPLLASALPSDDSGVGSYWVSKNPTALTPVLGLKVPATVAVENGKVIEPVKLSIASNYSKFIDRWQVRFYPQQSSVDSDAFYILQGKLKGAITEAEWNGEVTAGDLFAAGFSPGDKIEVALRVYDENGKFDQTVASTIELTAPEVPVEKETTLSSAIEVSIKSLNERVEQISMNFAQQSIAVTGSTVTVRGQDLRDVKSIDLNGEKITLDSDNSFAMEYILPPGEHIFDIIETRKTGEKVGRELDVEVKPGYFFMVGIADLTVGENKVSGSVEPLAVDDHHYGGDLFVDGRLAFYLKGKVKGKYLITAQMDTGNDDVSELFSDFHRKDARGVFRRIDPDQYYLVYGDDSNIVDDTNSQGKLYLRVDWDKSHALWGNFNTAFSGSEFAPFNRSLYGAQFVHSSMDVTALGDNQTELSAFMSEAQTLFRHNEFTGTGGSLYYLRDQDIVLGSEKVWVEVRRSNSEQVLQKVVLERGRDYEIDEFQGRIILTRPLLSVSAQSGPSIIRDEPQPGDNTLLVVDYEYVPSDFVSGDAALGLRGKRWLTDHIAVGGTWAHENRDTDDYDVKGVDVTFKKSDDTYVRFEAAQSESGQTSGSFMSDDGGLTFTAFNANSGVTSGSAIGLEARASAKDFGSLEKPVTVAAWAKRRDAGFSNAAVDTGADTIDTGLEVIAEYSDVLVISGRATRLEKTTESVESGIAVQADYAYTDKLTLSGEVRRTTDEALDTGDSESATLVAGKMQAQLTDALSVYGAAQGVLDKSGNYDNNTLLTAGAKAQVDDDLSIYGEVSSGDRGTNLMLGAEKRIGDTYTVYSNVNLLNDRDDNLERLVTLGQRKDVTDKLKIYTEHQFSSEEKNTGVTNTIGLTNTFNRYTTGSLSFQSSRLEDDTDAITERDTLTAGLSFRRNQSHLTSKLEYRQDESETVDTDQWVMTNNLEYRHSRATRWQVRLNHSETKDNLASDDARFTEAGIGFAHRPVWHDRLNLLGRYTYLYDLPPASQSDSADRRSTILSFESIYDIAKRWSVGGKLAYREGEIRTQRSTGGWVGNDASLAALRFRYKAPFGVDAMGSYHWLVSDSSGNTRDGALVSVGHNVGDNLQFSVGYNFTSFDDDLSNEDYDVRGWFLNFVGKY